MAATYAAGRDDESEALGAKYEAHVLAVQMTMFFMRLGIDAARLMDPGTELAIMPAEQAARAAAAESQAGLTAPAAAPKQQAGLGADTGGRRNHGPGGPSRLVKGGLRRRSYLHPNSPVV